MHIGNLSNQELLQIYNLLKEYSNFLDSELSKLEEKENEGKSGNTNK